MWKTSTKERNKKVIIVYYVLALIAVSIGLSYNDSRWYVLGVTLILLALFRKYWLMKKLKE